jgi:hypothetical protein
MKLKDALREWLGNEWGKMLVLLVMLAVLPVSTLIIKEYALSAILSLLFIGPFLGFVLLRHYLGITSLRKLTEIVLSLVAGICVLCLAAVGIRFAFQNWYPHSLATVVFINGNWMDGEKTRLHTGRKESALSAGLHCQGNGIGAP